MESKNGKYTFDVQVDTVTQDLIVTCHGGRLRAKPGDVIVYFGAGNVAVFDKEKFEKAVGGADGNSRPRSTRSKGKSKVEGEGV